MNQDDYKRLKQVVSAVLELPNNERLKHLQTELSDSKEMFDKACRMLSFENKTFLNEHVNTEQESLIIPTTFKTYEIIRKIGVGGMGAVYLANQKKPAERKVAIKFINTRFNKNLLFAECQVLARLNHPNVATLFEADTLDDGTMFIVMEYIEGTDLMSWYRDKSTNYKDKIKIFNDVCAGISHAHRKGIIHCDIKPSNIIIKSHENSVVTKIIDFGISRSEDNATNTSSLSGTQGYLAPECMLESYDDGADIRRDIYSLGVLLHQLIYDQLPPSNFNQLSPKNDLDFIIRKATAFEANERYETVSALQQDLQLSQNNMPISLRANEWFYVTKKLLRRRMGAFLFSTAIVVSLVIGYIAQSIQADKARNQALVAQTAEKLATEKALAAMIAEQEALKTANFVTELFDLANPERAGAQDLTALSLVTQAKESLMSIEDPTLSDARFMHTLGAIFSRMGKLIQASELLNASLRNKRMLLSNNDAEIIDDMIELGIIYRRLNKVTESKKILEDALKIVNENPLELRSQYGFIHNHLGNLAWQVKDYEQAVIHHKDAIAVRIELNQTTLLGDSYNNLGVIYRNFQQWPEAHNYLYQALDIYEQHYGKSHPFVGGVKNNLALVEENLFNWEKAESLLQEALSSAQNSYGKFHSQSIKIMRNIAFYYDRRHQFDQSLEMWQQIVTAHKANNESNDYINAIGYKALVHKDIRQFDTAKQLHQESLELYDKSELVNTVNNIKPRLLMRYAQTLTATGEYSMAESLALDANQLFLVNYPENYYIRLALLNQLGELYIQMEDFLNAEKYFNLVVNTADNSYLNQKQKVNSLLGLGTSYTFNENHEQAESTLDEAYQLSVKILGIKSDVSAKILFQKGLLRLKSNQFNEANKFISDAYEIQQLVLPSNHPDLQLTKAQLTQK